MEDIHKAFPGGTQGKERHPCSLYTNRNRKCDRKGKILRGYYLYHQETNFSVEFGKGTITLKKHWDKPGGWDSEDQKDKLLPTIFFSNHIELF